MDIKNVLKVESGNEKTRIPLVLDSPHSGFKYPRDFNYSCPKRFLDKSIDAYVEQLFERGVDYGADLLHALFVRTYIDPNRNIMDIDPLLLSKPWPGPIKPSEKSKLGVGLIRRLCTKDLMVYQRKLTPVEVKKRIDNYYTPYHRALEKLINQAYKKFGFVWHLNCHSMPSAVPTTVNVFDENKGYDFVLGNRDGTTASAEFTNFIKDLLTQMGYKVSLNHPYKGVELVQAYSNVKKGIESVQIEINRALYMDEETLRKTNNFKFLSRDIDALLYRLSLAAKDKIAGRPIDINTKENSSDLHQLEFE